MEQQDLSSIFAAMGWQVLPPQRYACDIRRMLQDQVQAVGWTTEDAYLSSPHGDGHLVAPLRIWWAGNGWALAHVLWQYGYRIWWNELPGAPIYVGLARMLLTHIPQWTPAPGASSETWAAYHYRRRLETTLQKANWSMQSVEVLEQVLALLQ